MKAMRAAVESSISVLFHRAFILRVFHFARLKVAHLFDVDWCHSFGLNVADASPLNLHSFMRRIAYLMRGGGGGHDDRGAAYIPHISLGFQQKRQMLFISLIAAHALWARGKQHAHTKNKKDMPKL